MFYPVLLRVTNKALFPSAPRTGAKHNNKRWSSLLAVMGTDLEVAFESKKPNEKKTFMKTFPAIQLRQEARSADNTLEQLQQEAIKS